MVRGLEQTNRVSTEYPIIIERSGMEWNECIDPMMELLIDLDKISENGRNIYESNQINQTINTRNRFPLNILKWTIITSRELDIL